MDAFFAPDPVNERIQQANGLFERHRSRCFKCASLETPALETSALLCKVGRALFHLWQLTKKKWEESERG